MTLRQNNIFIKIHSNQWILSGLLLIISLLISIQNISLGINNFWGGQYTHYNNFLIFKNSFSHLLGNKNLYEFYFDEYADLYKYSPTFALIMGTFYYLPESLGLFLWNSLNIFVLYFAIFSLKSIDPSRKSILVFFLLFELILSTQNSQSNALLAGLTIIAFNLFERGKNTQATFFIALGTFIKLYSIVGCLLLLLYPNKIKSTVSSLVWMLLFFLLPLILIDFHSLIWQYKNWYIQLKIDQSESIGMSAYKFTQLVLPMNYFKLTTILFGVFVLLTPLLKFKAFVRDRFRLHFLILILIWIVVFNYKAESPTYIIAMTGIGIWFFDSLKSKLNLLLFLLTFFFTSIWFTDIIPSSIKNNFIDLKFIKPFFPILVLLKVYFELILMRIDRKTEAQNQDVAHNV